MFNKTCTVHGETFLFLFVVPRWLQISIRNLGLNLVCTVTVVRWPGWQAAPRLAPAVALGWGQDTGLRAPVSFRAFGLTIQFFQLQHKEIPAKGPNAGSRAES